MINNLQQMTEDNNNKQLKLIGLIFSVIGFIFFIYIYFHRSGKLYLLHLHLCMKNMTFYEYLKIDGMSL